MYVANNLADCEARRELMLKSLQVFVQQGIEAKIASDKADITHKVSSSLCNTNVFSLVCLSHIII